MMPPIWHDASRSFLRPRRRVGMALAIGALAIASGACALTKHSIPPYRDDPAAAAALEARAVDRCRDLRVSSGLGAGPERPFRTDGCSAWPDSAATRPCCIEHDIDYWCGGTRAQRLAADDAFGVCVAERAESPFFGGFMRAGVRMGGHPFFPMPYRWGYGDPWTGGYPREAARPDSDESDPSAIR